ncbi:hypothetical protein [Aequorivita sp. CIP111184]|uniref:hypothetical protein n=1 Tax=Aequorivita sp. CIP111184 TaxID=2211356 RepID=UPI000DBC16C9|nr:hypothetical protein [Aequorivita sp. CIP111184]SRX55465.1 hypothetical protein AEQU1_02487 [Aequorivita sp. CIP111184]
MYTEGFKISVLLFTLFLVAGVYGQNAAEEYENTKASDSSYISVEISFINDAIFMGRKDSISAPYLYPSITYHNKSGFYASGSLSYLTRSEEARVDLFLVTAGFDFTAKKLEGDISATKYFFNDDSYNVISEVVADITVLLKYDFNIINLGLGSSIYFSSDSSSDFFLAPEISHDFISKDQKFQISPTAGVYLGSQNFYEQYYINNRFGNGRGQGQGQGSGDNTQGDTNIEMQEGKEFGLMAIEFSLPMWYSYKSMTLSFLPAYVLAQNPATLTIDGVVFKEDLENTFYWMIGVGYRF